MPSFNIHWRGCPHRHLPRIPSTSIRRASLASRSVAQTAAEDVMKLPLDPALQQERRKQRSKARSRWSRSSRCSATTLSRRRVSHRATRNTHSFERQLSRIYLNKVRTQDPSFKTSTREQRKKPKEDVPAGSSNDTVLHVAHNDGARSSIRALKNKTGDSNGIYSMMHVAEGSGYWTSNKPAPRSKRSPGSSKRKNTEGKRPGEYAHTGPLEIANGQRKVHHLQNEWCRSYDPRIDPHCFTDGGDERGQSIPIQGNNPAQASMACKNPGTEDTLWETVDSSRFPQDNETSSSPSITSVVPSLLSSSPFRTGSEAKRLTRFTKELELHYTAVQSLPNKSLLISPSATTASANTVGPLVPFHAEFQSAGLAVTSKEQRRLPGQRPNVYNRNSDCLSTVADRRPVQCCGHDGQRSFASGTTGTTVLGFTPPHEKTYGRSGQSRARGSSTGSGFTAVGFTPPHEKMMTAPPLQAPKLLPTSMIRVPRPWLDNEEKSPKAPLSPAKVSVASAKKYREPGGTNQTPPIDYVPRPSTDERWTSERNNTASTERDTIQESPRRTATTQTEPLGVSYRQVATQTTVSDLKIHRRNEPKSENQDALKSRAKRSSTFPSKVDKCDETCNRGEAKAVEIPGWIRSRLPWERKANPPQTTREHATSPEIAYPPQDREKTNENPYVRPKNRSLDLRPDTTKSGRVSNEQQLGTESAKVRCARCGVMIDEDVDSMDGQAEPSSSREPLCRQCSASVYTVYVTPPKRAQYSQARQSEKSTALEPPLKTAGTDKNKPPEKVPEPEYNDEKGHEGIWTHIKNAEHSLADCAKMWPVVDPVKKPSKPRQWSCATTSPDSGRENMEYFPPTQPETQRQTRRGGGDINSKHLPSQDQTGGTRHYSTEAKHHQQQTQVNAMAHKNPSSSAESQDKSHRSNEPSNQQVFHGLQVATAAACDEDLDKWISEINGSGVRHFLADLSKFEPLGVNTLASVARKAAKQKKEQIRAWEKVREEKLKNDTDESKDGQGRKDQPLKMGNEIDGKADERSDDWLVGDLGVRQR